MLKWVRVEKSRFIANPDSLTKQVELQRQKVAALSSAHQNSVETKGEDARATQELEIKLNKARLNYLHGAEFKEQTKR